MRAESIEFIEMPNLNGKLYEATGRLTEAVSHFYHLYMPVSEPAVIKHLAPNLEMMLVFNFGPPIEFSFGNEKPGSKTIEKTAVIGPLRKMLNYELKPGDDLIVVNFKMNGFYRLFKVSLNSIHEGDAYDPDVLLGKSCFSDIWLQLVQMTSINDRLDLLGRYGVEHLIENDLEVIPLLKGEHYFYNNALQPVKAIASDIKVTERTVQLRFKKYAGYSPKELLRFLRFKKMIAGFLNKENTDADVFSLIHTYGYYDQSHLIKDFKYFLGTTPLQFTKELKNKHFYMPGLSQG